MENKLIYIFENTNNWLKYGEAKNAGLSAFNVAIVIGVLQLGKLNVPLTIAMFLLLTSILFNIYSILPILNKWYKFYSKVTDQEFAENIDKYNSIFFGDLSKLNQKQLLQLLQKDKEITLQVHGSAYEKDLAQQIVTNSEIALQKFKIFSKAGYLTISSLAVLMVHAVMIIV